MSPISQDSKGLQSSSDAARRANLEPRIGESVTLANELKEQIKEGRFDEIEWWRNREVSKLARRAMLLTKQLKAIRKRPDAKAVFAQHDADNYHAYLWMLSWAADALEYTGDVSEIRPLLELDGHELYIELQDTRSVLPQHRRLARQKIWVVLHYAHSCFYRNYEYQQALDVIDLCQKVIVDYLKDDDSFPCYYTRARISAYRAAIQRQLGHWKQASRSYEESVNCIHRRIARESENARAMPERFHQEEIRSSYEIAKTLALGIGYCQKAQGLLHAARANVQTALVMLSPIRDVLCKAYAQLLLNSIDRAAAGFHVGRLTDVIASLAKPRKCFIKYHHERYRSRADYELALAHLCRANAVRADKIAAEEDYAKAQVYIRRVLKFSKKANDRRWEAIAFIVLSRISRGRASLLEDPARAKDIKAARGFAQQALDQARILPQDASLQLDCEISAGEALLVFAKPSPADLRQALGHFERALSRAGRNPILLGVSHLHLVDAHLRNNNLRSALAHFGQWKLVRESVEQGVIHDMAKDLGARLDQATHSQYMADGRETLNHKSHEKRLRKFLFNQAVIRGGDPETMAKALGIKRAAFYKWQKEFRSDL